MTKLVESQDKGHLAVLKALLNELLEGMQEADPNVMPQFAARIQAVSAEIETLRPKEESAADELAARRKARRLAANAKLRVQRRRRTENRN